MTDKPHATTKAFQGMLDQAEVNYVPLSMVKGKACANCRWFMNFGCFIVEGNEPEPILATGYCDRHELTPAPVPAPDIAATIADAVVEAVETIGENITSFMPMEMSHEKERQELIIDPAPSLLTQMQNRLRREPLKDGVQILKDNAGRRYMYMITSNGYRDRDNAHVTTKAIEDYVDHCWTPDDKFIGDNNHYIWHTKELGSISDLMFADVWSGFLVEVWREKADNPLAKGFYNYVEKHPEMEWGASQGFFASKTDKEAGVYKSIAKYESTSLPRSAAANVYTLSEVLPMIEKSKRDDFLNSFFKEEFGIEKAADLLKQGPEKLRATLADRGVEAKALGGDAVQKARGEAMAQAAELIVSVVEVQDAVEKQLETLTTNHTKELQLRDDKIATVEKAANMKLTQLEKEVGEIRALVNAGPRRASQDSSTTVTDADKEVLKDALPPDDSLSKWIGLPTKKATS